MFEAFTFNSFAEHPQREYFKALYERGEFRKQIVVAAACRSADKEIMLVSARHWDLAMNKQLAVLSLGWVDFPICEQGFIDQYGNYLSREVAAKIVIQNEQPLRRPLMDEALYSENLY